MATASRQDDAAQFSTSDGQPANVRAIASQFKGSSVPQPEMSFHQVRLPPHDMQVALQCAEIGSSAATSGEESRPLHRCTPALTRVAAPADEMNTAAISIIDCSRTKRKRSTSAAHRGMQRQCTACTAERCVDSWLDHDCRPVFHGPLEWRLWPLKVHREQLQLASWHGWLHP